MNSGAEAVETVIKAVRKWGYKEKGSPPIRLKSSFAKAISTEGP